VIDIGDGLAAIFKMESHNHPSFIEPYQGAATGVGGILRDVFTMGARPIANLNALRFGDRPMHPKMRHLDGVVRGIGGYGNCVGVPTVGGEVNFHPAYNGNILVNAMTVGIAEDRQDFLFGRMPARQPGRLCRLQDRPRRHPRRHHGLGRIHRGFGGEAPHRAGRRSLHRKAADRGLPRTDGTDAIVAIQDMGAAGLTSSSVEMAGKGGVGIELDHRRRSPAARNRHDALRDDALRIAGAHADGAEARPRAAGRGDLPQKWELDFAVIGHLTDTGRMVLTLQRRTRSCDIPLGSARSPKRPPMTAARG
jgi:phosphoribosylformylglycinamidine (FGAM) synthase-like enzyme